jgi:hypothetical protein
MPIFAPLFAADPTAAPGLPRNYRHSEERPAMRF